MKALVGIALLLLVACDSPTEPSAIEGRWVLWQVNLCNNRERSECTSYSGNQSLPFGGVISGSIQMDAGSSQQGIECGFLRFCSTREYYSGAYEETREILDLPATGLPATSIQVDRGQYIVMDNEGQFRLWSDQPSLPPKNGQFTLDGLTYTDVTMSVFRYRR